MKLVKKAQLLSVIYAVVVACVLGAIVGLASVGIIHMDTVPAILTGIVMAILVIEIFLMGRRVGQFDEPQEDDLSK